MDQRLFKIYLIIFTNIVFVGSTVVASELSEQSSDSILVKHSIDHIFSDPLEEDVFSIKIIGNSLIKAEVLFTIMSKSGDEIYSARFPSVNLLGYAFSYEEGTVSEKESYIKQKVLNFFSEENFTYPAIKDDDIFDQDYSNKQIWNDIKSDNQSIGFCYRVSGGYYRKIAYSKTKKQTVVYFECC